jgi:hypothetical protein
MFEAELQRPITSSTRAEVAAFRVLRSAQENSSRQLQAAASMEPLKKGSEGPSLADYQAAGAAAAH